MAPKAVSLFFPIMLHPKPTRFTNLNAECLMSCNAHSEESVDDCTSLCCYKWRAPATTLINPNPWLLAACRVAQHESCYICSVKGQK